MRNRTGIFSVEFFPPKTAEGVEKLRTARRSIAELKPAFCSVTFGAGGSTREGTLETVLEIRSEGFAATPHISCIGTTTQGVRDVLARYKDHGIRHLVALRGDLPSGAVDAGDFHYASELVEFIRRETGDWFHIDVAAYPEYHPQSRSPQEDLANFQRKVAAGANSAIPQSFFNGGASARDGRSIRWPSRRVRRTYSKEMKERASANARCRRANTIPAEARRAARRSRRRRRADRFSPSIRHSSPREPWRRPRASSR